MSAECVGGKRLMGVVKIQINNMRVFGRCSSSFAMIKLSTRGTAAFWKAWRGCSSQVSPMNPKAKIIATL